MYQEELSMEGLGFAVSGYISDWRDVTGVSSLVVVISNSARYRKPFGAGCEWLIKKSPCCCRGFVWVERSTQQQHINSHSPR